MKKSLIVLGLFMVGLLSGCQIAPFSSKSPKPQMSVEKKDQSLMAFFLWTYCPNHICTTVNIDLVNYAVNTVEDTADNHGLNYTPPNNADIGTFKEVVADILARRWQSAQQKAQSIQYEIVRVNDTGEVAGCDKTAFHMLRPTGNGVHTTYGYYFFRAHNAPRRDMVVEAPHVGNEGGTARLGAELFRNQRARVLALSSNHRCDSELPDFNNNQNDQVCSGQTKVCSDDKQTNQPYRESDVAHTPQSYFQAFHQVLNDNTTMPFIQLHGKGAYSPAFILSNGKKITSQNLNVHVNALSMKLIQRINAYLGVLQQPTKVGASCSWSGNGALVNSTELCATKNTQGRYSNYQGNEIGGDVCTDTPGNVTERFYHVELSLDMRDDSQSSQHDIPRQMLGGAISTVTANGSKLFPLLNSKFPCRAP